MDPKSSLPSLLVISSRREVLSFYRLRLKNTFHVLEASDVERAREIISYTSIDYYILDDQLSNPSFQHYLSLIPQTPTPLPIFLVTSHLRKDFINECIALKISYFLHEPLDVEELITLIKKYHLSKNPPTPNFLPSLPLPSETLHALYAHFSAYVVESYALKKALDSQEIVFPLCILSIDIDETILHNKEVEVDIILKTITEHKRIQDLITYQPPSKIFIFFPQTSETAGKIISEDIFKELSSLTGNYSVSPLKSSFIFYKKDKDKEKFLQEIDKVLQTASITLGQAKYIDRNPQEYQG